MADLRLRPRRLGGLALPANMEAALEAATAASGTNPFATTSDVAARGYTVVEVPFALSGGLGPKYTEAAGPPDASDGTIGSVYRDTGNDDVYYKTSSGWSGPHPAPGAPITFGSDAPQSWQGNDGEYFCDYRNLDFYGPKALGAWPAPNPIMGWQVHPLAGPPASGDGAEGDWAWYSPAAGSYRLYGPKLSTGWPSTYREFTGVLEPTTVAFQQGVSTGAGQDQIMIRPGDGYVYHNFNTYTLDAGGYTVRRELFVDPAVNMPADQLVIGGELETSAYTKTGSDLAVTATVDGVEVPLGAAAGGGAGESTFGLVPDTSAARVKSLAKQVAGGQVLGKLRVGSGTPGNLADVTSFSGTLKLYVLPAAA